MGSLTRLIAYSVVAASSALVFGFSATSAPVQVALQETSLLAANAVVGVFAGVAENPYNTLAQQLEEKEAELRAREAALDAQSREPVAGGTPFPFGLVSFFLSLGVLVLVALNFLFDWRRTRNGQPGRQNYSVNLRQ